MIELIALGSDSPTPVTYFSSVQELCDTVGYHCPGAVHELDTSLKKDGIACISNKFCIKLIDTKEQEVKFHDTEYQFEFTASTMLQCAGSVNKAESQLGIFYVQITTRTFRVVQGLNFVPYQRLKITFTDTNGRITTAGIFKSHIREVNIALPKYNLNTVTCIFEGVSHNPQIKKVQDVLNGEEPDILITDGELELRIHSKVMAIFTDQFKDTVKINKGEMNMMVILIRWCYFGVIPKRLPWKLYFDTSTLAKRYKVVGIIRTLTWFVQQTFTKSSVTDVRQK